MNGAVARVVLRYPIGFLLGKALVPAGTIETIVSDPDLIALVGGVMLAGVEGYYYLAKRWGWNT